MPHHYVNLVQTESKARLMMLRKPRPGAHVLIWVKHKHVGQTGSDALGRCHDDGICLCRVSTYTMRIKTGGHHQKAPLSDWPQLGIGTVRTMSARRQNLCNAVNHASGVQDQVESELQEHQIYIYIYNQIYIYVFLFEKEGKKTSHCPTVGPPPAAFCHCTLAAMLDRARNRRTAAQRGARGWVQR